MFGDLVYKILEDHYKDQKFPIILFLISLFIGILFAYNSHYVWFFFFFLLSIGFLEQFIHSIKTFKELLEEYLKKDVFENKKAEYVVEGDIIDQKTDIIVNAWNCNFIPWFLLLPKGVSKAIKKESGYKPFWELLIKGPMKAGSALITNSGNMDCKYIIHVAGINCFWFSTYHSISNSVKNAMGLAISKGCKSIAFPIIGSGTGGFKEDIALAIMIDELEEFKDKDIKVVIVKYKK